MISVRHKGKHLAQRIKRQRWKAALAVFLSVLLVFQSSNIQAVAAELLNGSGADQTPIVEDRMADETTSEEGSTEEADPADEAAEPVDEEAADPTGAAGNEEVTVEEQPDEAAESAAPVEQADTTVTLNVDITGATLKYMTDDGEKTVAPADENKTVEVSDTLDFKFTVVPDDGQQVSSVKIGEKDLTADADGTYTIAAADLTDDATIAVSTEPVPAEEAAETNTADEATEDEAPADTNKSDAAVTDEVQTDDGSAVQVLEQDDQTADVSSPAYEGYAYVGDVVVKVTAGEGVLPEGATVSAYQVNRQDVIDAVADVVESDGQTELKNSVAIDVTLIGPDGNVIQPEGAVNVCFFNTNLGDGAISVYRVANDASSVQKIGTRQADASVQSFDVDHFSIYLVGEEVRVVTYEFWAGDELVSSQVVKDGDVLYEPAIPEQKGSVFAGWKMEGDQDFFDFDSPVKVNEDSPTNKVRVNATFDEAVYVFFMDGRGDDARVIRTKQGASSDAVTVDDVAFPVDSVHGIEGWYYDQGLTDRVEDNQVSLANGDVTLYPNVVSGNYITFDSNGGSYVAPEFYLPDANTKAPQNPTRAGYTFDGWTSDIEGNNEYQWGSTISDPITLYAQWNPREDTKYTVIYWVENANDDDYSYYKSETRQGTSGSTTNISASDRDIAVTGVKDIFGNDAGEWDRTARENLAYPYHVSKERPVENTTIKGDGSTIVNVYYDRNEYTLTFKESRNSSQIVKKITLKWGQNLNKNEWPSSGNNRENDNWLIGSNSYLAFTSTMPYGGGTLWKPSVGYGPSTETAYYYTESLDREYELDHYDTALVSSSMNVAAQDRYEINGFTLNESRSTKVGRPYDNAKFYYDRNSYSIVYINNGIEEHTAEYKYEQDISDAGNYIPERGNVPSNYEFKGWYADPEGEVPFSFDGETMPAYNITVYAKWAAPTHTVKFYDADCQLVDTATVEDDAAIDQNDIPSITVPEGYQLFGWATKDDEGNLVPYNLDEHVFDDLELYPYLVSNAKVQVTYDENGGNGTVADDKQYAQGSYADIQSAEGVTAPSGKVFVGWSTEKDGQGDIYYPGGKMEITAEMVSSGKVILYAQWADASATTTITYVANYPGITETDQPANKVVTIDVNKEHSVYTLTEAGFTAPQGYRFTGWKADDGKTYKPDDIVAADNQDPKANTLTAQWEVANGVVAYNLSLDTASWQGDVPEGLVYYRDASNGAPIYKMMQSFGEGDTTRVIGDIPTADGYAFVGWWDKLRTGSGDDEGTVYSEATFRAEGDTITYPYNGKLANAADYTLDAVWAYMDVEGGEYVYDGNVHSVKAQSAFSKSIEDEYIQQIIDSGQLVFGEMRYYLVDDEGEVIEDYGTTNPEFEDAGTYHVKVTQDVTANGVKTTISDTATITIAKRPVALTGSATKTYDGTDALLGDVE
ncbi:InlB B-repeat-containing protein, partial [Thermophilibacter sp.]